MRFLRLAACAAAFAVVGGMAVAEDMDIKALQAKLAAQEARLNDLQAKMSTHTEGPATPSNITSIRRNAKVTIGGAIAPRYTYRSGSIDVDENLISVGGHTDANRKTADFEMDTVALEVKVDINENMDAFIKLNMNDTSGRDEVSGIGEAAWVRWKNISNTGWGLLIGRDSMKFMSSPPIGLRSQWNRDQGSENLGIPNMTGTSRMSAADSEGFFTDGSYVPSHLGGTQGRTTQINAFWKNAAETLTLDFSVFQSLERKNGAAGNVTEAGDREQEWRTINYGLGTGAFRAIWKPTEEWTFTFGAVNMRANDNGWQAYRAQGNGYGAGNTPLNSGVGHRFAKNDSAFHLGFAWNPTFLCNNNLTIWANMTQEYNAGWTDGLDNTSTSFGLVYKLTEKLTAYVEGSYMYAKNSLAGQNWYKADGWRGAIGASYNMGNGFALDVEYLHGEFDYENRRGQKHTEAKGDTFVTNLGFSF